MSFEPLENFFLFFQKIWDTPIVQIKGVSMTIGTLSLGIILLFLSFFLANFLSKHIGKKILSRVKEIDEASRISVQKIIYYILLLIFIVFSLGILNVPLTVLTVFGGALAIGVGLGAQNIMNNFISGLVMIMERPIRVGDVVEVEDLRGRVEDIGARSTKITSINNTTIIVPNSTFLEKKILNWTLSDRIVRSIVKVGVSYGSPTTKVKELLLKVAEDNKKVLSYPEPVAVFSDFGDDALQFELYFYSYIENVLQLKIISSDIRFAIDSIFTENGIVIAFPQRDLHIKNSSLKVDLIR